MALSNTQYSILMRRYEARQLQNQRIVMERIRCAYQKLPRLAEIDNEVSSLAVEQAKRLIDGDETSLFKLRNRRHALAEEKNSFLRIMVIQMIILNRHAFARTVKIPVISMAENATVLSRPLLTLYIRSPISERFWKQRILPTFPLIITRTGK